MDQKDPYDLDRLNSNGSQDNNDTSQGDLWDEDEDFELGSDENELFLRDEYVKPTTNDILPFRLSTPSQLIMANQHNQRNGFAKHSGKLKGPGQHPGEPRETRFETFQVDDSGHGSPTPPSVIYQMPNYDQFAANLTPTSPTSVILSFVIIFVILAVTILPKVIPKSQPLYADGLDAYDEDVIEDSSMINGSFFKEYSNRPVHSDARCKCICPPLLSSTSGSNNGSISNASGSGTNSTASSDKTHKNSTTISNSKTVNERRLYVGNTLPDQCNCNNIVLAHLQEDIKVSLKEFCARCECRYQNRNTTTIKRIVVFFIAVLSGLALYLFVQYLLRHLRITRRSLPPHLRWLSHQIESH